MQNFLVTLENQKTGTFPTYVSKAPDFQSCYEFEKDVITRFQKIRPHIRLLTIERLDNDAKLPR